jgi:HAD superfamily hydrolase (TIGR01549 family)
MQNEIATAPNQSIRRPALMTQSQNRQSTIDNRQYRALLFDLDGTLRANMPEGVEAFIEYAARMGVALTAAQVETIEREVHRYWADGALVTDHLARYDQRGFWVNYDRILLASVGIDDHGSIAEQIQDEFNRYEPQDVLFADAPGVLAALHGAGYTLGLVSNRDGDLGPIVAGYGLAGYFHFTLSGGQARSWKPDSGIFLQALKLAGDVPPQQALYIGDNYYADFLGARAVGMDALLVDPHGIFRNLCEKRIRTLREILPTLGLRDPHE